MKEYFGFYYITDDNIPDFSHYQQVKVVLEAGVTIIQYRNKKFNLNDFEEVLSIRELCTDFSVPFIVNDNVLLAKSVGADGVHLGQDDEDLSAARKVLGNNSIIGLTVSNLDELATSNIDVCDYIGTGPVFPTNTKQNAKKVCHLSGLKNVIDESKVPVVAIGGINDVNAQSCFDHGASGVALISYISRSKTPYENALKFNKFVE